MKRFLLKTTLILLMISLATGCDLFSIFHNINGGPPQLGKYDHYYGMIEANEMLYLSNYRGAVTTIAIGEPINLEGFSTTNEAPHGIAYGGGSGNTTNIWICDLNKSAIESYTGGVLDSTTLVGTEPVNLLFLPKGTKDSIVFPRRLLVADRSENCLYVLPFENDEVTLTSPDEYNQIDLSTYMNEKSIGYIDMYYAEDGLVYIVSDEFFGFLTINMYDSNPTNTITSYKFEGTPDITENRRDYTDMGGMGIAVHNSQVYVNTGGRIIRSSLTGTGSEVLCTLKDIYPETYGYYIDLVISNKLRTDGFTQKNDANPSYIFVTSGLFWEKYSFPHVIVRYDMNGESLKIMDISDFL